MLVLLPPSESKNPPPRRGAPLDLEALSFPELTATRARVLDAAIETSGRPDGLRRLEVGRAVAAEVERNTRLRTLPTRPALEVYSGVLYDALGYATLPTAARRRAASRLVVVSGLWGALRPRDRIPAYRLNVCAQLVGLPALEPMWRPVLGPVLADAAGPRGLVVDCRSSSYTAMGMPTGLGDRTVAVRVVRADGRVVSHMAKHTRGLVVRHLLESGADPRTPDALAGALADRWQVDVRPPGRPGGPWTATVTSD